jgi:hypothetical protein
MAKKNKEIKTDNKVKKAKKLTFEQEVAQFEENIKKNKTVPFSKLSKEDQALIEPSEKLKDFHTYGNSVELQESHELFTSEIIDEALKSSGQLTEKELLEVSKLSKEEKKKFFINGEEFTNLVIDDVPFDEMMTMVTSLVTRGVSHKSFDEVVEKFFYFHLGKMDLKELIVLKYKVDNILQEKAMGKLEENHYNSQRVG